MTDKQYEDLSRKIDILVRLLAFAAVADKKSQQEQFLVLSNAGLQPKDIAEILGTTPNTVRVGLSTIRKKTRSRR